MMLDVTGRAFAAVRPSVDRAGEDDGSECEGGEREFHDIRRGAGNEGNVGVNERWTNDQRTTDKPDRGGRESGGR